MALGKFRPQLKSHQTLCFPLEGDTQTMIRHCLSGGLSTRKFCNWMCKRSASKMLRTTRPLCVLWGKAAKGSGWQAFPDVSTSLVIQLRTPPVSKQPVRHSLTWSEFTERQNSNHGRNFGLFRFRGRQVGSHFSNQAPERDHHPSKSVSLSEAIPGKVLLGSGGMRCTRQHHWF